MPVLSTIVSPEQQESRPAASNQEERWYAAYTCANHEKRVAAQLRDRSIEHLLPLYSSTRRWKDRRVLVEFPLFPGYVFVRLALCDRLRILQIPSLVRLVGFGGQPCALPEEDIHAIQKCLDRGYQVEPHPFLTVGRPVRVKSGPLAGMHGILVQRKGKYRVVISIDLIQRSIQVDIETDALELTG